MGLQHGDTTEQHSLPWQKPTQYCQSVILQLKIKSLACMGKAL